MLWIGIGGVVLIAVSWVFLSRDWEAIGGLLFFLGLVAVGIALGVDWNSVSADGGCPPNTC